MFYFIIFLISGLRVSRFFFFFLNDPPPTEIYPLPLHDALPISDPGAAQHRVVPGRRARLPRGRPTDARAALRARGSEPARVPPPQRARALALRRPADRPAVGETGPAQARAPLDPGRGGHEGVATPHGRRRADGEAGLALVLGAE